MTLDEITEAALSLPSDARALLADMLVQSLEPADDDSLPQPSASEALRRLDEVRSGRIRTIPGEEALASVRNRFSK